MIPVDGCERCKTPYEHGDVRCAVCAFVFDAPPSPGTDRPRARIVRCTECAAAVAFVAEVGAPRCAFCNAIAKIEVPVDPIERAQLSLPVGVDKPTASAALRGWLGRRGWFAPDDLASAAALDSMQLLHWSAWVVDAKALVSWAADSDFDSHRSAWAPHAGQVSMDFRGTVVPATRGLTYPECAALSPGYDLATANPIGDDLAAIPGQVEAFDAQRSAARKTVLSAIEATAAARLQQGTIPGRRFRNVKVGVMLESMTTRRVVLPVWILAYRYRGHPYRALVNGQQAACVTGESPTSTWKVLLVIGVIALVLLAIFAVVSS